MILSVQLVPTLVFVTLLSLSTRTSTFVRTNIAPESEMEETIFHIIVLVKSVIAWLCVFQHSSV